MGKQRFPPKLRLQRQWDPSLQILVDSPWHVQVRHRKQWGHKKHKDVQCPWMACTEVYAKSTLLFLIPGLARPHLAQQHLTCCSHACSCNKNIHQRAIQNCGQCRSPSNLPLACLQQHLKWKCSTNYVRGTCSWLSIQKCLRENI